MQKHVRQRLHLAPVFTRKLMLMPLNLGHPAWIEASAVDIDFHVRRADSARKGARPMTLAEAHQRCAQLHSELLDRRFPLWEFHVFDRIALPDGRIVAGFLSKIHHAALDGKGAVLLANATLDTSPLPRKVPPPDPARQHPTDSEADLGTRSLIASVLSTSLGQFSRLAKALPSSLRAIGSTLIQQSSADPSTGQRARMPMKLAPHTPFNIGIGTARVFAAATLPLQECKALNITIQTYDGNVDFGIVADSQALPHADDLARAIEAAFTQAQSLMGDAAAAAEKGTPAAPAAKAKPRTRQPSNPKAAPSARLESSTSSKRRQRLDTERVSTEKK